MSRRRAAIKREVLPDHKFKDKILTKFMNRIMLDGKKSVSENIVYGENLCCNQFIINERDINSTDKINDFFSRPSDESYYYTKGIQADPYNEPIEGIILGTLSDKDKNKLDSVDVSINDPDIDFTKVINIKNGDFPDLNDVPKNGEIFP